MSTTLCRLPIVVIALVVLIPLDAAMVSRESADALDLKIAQVRQQGCPCGCVQPQRQTP